MTNSQKPAARIPETKHRKSAGAQRLASEENVDSSAAKPDDQADLTTSESAPASGGCCDKDDQTYKNAKCWAVYIVKCSDGSLYTGITTDLPRRLNEHNGNSVAHANRGAAYTRTRRPVTLCYSETQPDRSAASRREYFIKRLARKDKQLLIDTQS